MSVGFVLALATLHSSAEPREVFPYSSSSKILRSDDLDSDWAEWKRTLLLGSGAIQPSGVVHVPSGLALNRLLRRIYEKASSSSSAARTPSSTTAIEEVPLAQGIKKRITTLDDLRYLTGEVSSCPLGPSTRLIGVLTRQ